MKHVSIVSRKLPARAQEDEEDTSYEGTTEALSWAEFWDLWVFVCDALILGTTYFGPKVL